MRRNLLLFGYPGIPEGRDLHRIAALLREIEPGILPRVLPDRRLRLRRLRFAARPTMVFCPVALQRFRPLRGAVFQGRALSKSEEYEALERARVPVPRWTRLRKPDLTGFPPYVVVKPDRGMRGAEVRIMRRGRAAERDDPRLLAQEFVYTGPWPVSYRVTTLFGKVIWSWKVEASRSRDPVWNPEAFDRHSGVSVVSSGKGCTFRPHDDEEVLRFGESAHAAFPEVPLLGVDVLRDVRTGRLFVAEVNASGWAWHYSSPTGLKIQREFGIDLEAQFGGFRNVASILAAKTLAAAR